MPTTTKNSATRRPGAPPLAAQKGAASGRSQDGLAAAQENAAAGYYARIEAYAQKIRQTGDVPGIVGLLDEALRDTHALHAVGELAAARRQVQAAERRIEELKAELELIHRLVREDPLTGALNRRGLHELLERETARADRSGTPLCVALIDIDDFKRINDRFGHEVGDGALRHLVAIISEALRPHDVVARHGGEEFAVVLPEASVAVATTVMERLQGVLDQRRYDTGTAQLHMTFSAGIAQRRTAESRDSLFARADQALYTAKREGKNRAIVAL